jgi:hypothetical protein
MEHITFEVSDKSKLEALKAYAATLGEINIVEEDAEIFYPFSKEESDRRLEESRKSLREKGGISIEQLEKNINQLKSKYLNGI